MDISADEPLAISTVSAIQHGAVSELKQLLSDNPELATARIIDSCGVRRSLLHIATDWPGHFPNVKETIAALVEAGADVNAQVETSGQNPSRESPLHWAASSNDVDAIDALLDAHADIEIPGAVFTNGPPISDAIVFAQWNAARRLVDRGAQTSVWQAAALGLLERVKHECEATQPPTKDTVTKAFWHACRGGQLETAKYLLECGADLNWVGWQNQTPLTAAEQSKNGKLVEWLRNCGAKNNRGE